MSNNNEKRDPLLCHWADRMADKIIQEKGDLDLYTCASGITPSGTVHLGNFREIITVDLVVRALRDRGKNVRFIYSWDDYDVFRKVPANMPDPEILEQKYQIQQNVTKTMPAITKLILNNSFRVLALLQNFFIRLAAIVQINMQKVCARLCRIVMLLNSV